MSKNGKRKVMCGSCGAERWVTTGGVLRNLRQQADVSLREMGRRLNLSAPYLCDVELDRRHVTPRIEAAYRKLTKQSGGAGKQPERS